MQDLHGYYLEDLKVGMTGAYAKTITEADIILFAGISGDNNPMHLNEEFAKQTMFKTRIRHCMLAASLISTIVGTRIPGPGAVYLGQTMRFKAPVKAGDTVRAEAIVKEINLEKRRVVLDTICTVNGKVVLDGEATCLVDRRADIIAVQKALEAMTQ